MVELPDKNNMSLKASKLFFGSPEADFSGHTLDKHSHQPNIYNLAPIKLLIAPSNIKGAPNAKKQKAEKRAPSLFWKCIIFPNHQTF